MCNRLFAVGEPVGIAVRLVRVRAVGQFLAVGYTIAIAVGFGWVGSSKAFFGVCKSVVVRVVGRIGYDSFFRATTTFRGLAVI